MKRLRGAIAAALAAALLSAVPAPAQEVTAHVLPSFGTAFQVVGGTSTLAGDWSFLFGSESFPDVVIEPPFTFEIVGRLRAFQAGSFGTLLRVGWGPSFLPANGVRLRLQRSTGEVLAVVDLGAGSQSLHAGHVVDPGDPFYVAFVVEEDGVTAKLYAGENADQALPVWEDTLVTPLAGGNWNRLFIGEPFGPTFDAWEARLWSVAHPREKLEALGDGPLEGALDQDDVIESWRFEEGEGSMAFGEKGRLNLDSGFLPPVWGGSQCTTVDLDPITRDECSLRILPTGQNVPGRVWCIHETCPGLSPEECSDVAPFSRPANPSVDPEVCVAAQAAADQGETVVLTTALYEGLFVVTEIAVSPPPPDGEPPPDEDDPEEEPPPPPPPPPDDNEDDGRGVGIVDEPRWINGDLCVDLEIQGAAGVSVTAGGGGGAVAVFWEEGDPDLLEAQFRVVSTGLSTSGRKTWSAWFDAADSGAEYSMALQNRFHETVATFGMGLPQSTPGPCAAAPTT